MRMTVRDLLDLDAFDPCSVAAGKRNLDNVIRSVSVMDAPDVATAMENNGVREQLVLTSFAAMETWPVRKEAVKELAKRGIGALVLFGSDKETGRSPAKGTDREKEELITMAEAIGLPLLVLPPANKASYADVIEQVMEKLLLGGETAGKLINNTISHLLDFEKMDSFPAALREAAVSNGFQVLLMSRDFNPVLVVETRHRVTVADAVRFLRQQEEETGSLYSFIEISGLTSYWGTISIEGEKYFLFLVDNEDRFSAPEMTKLAEIIELAIGMWKYTPVRDIRVELIRALMRGNRSRAYTLREEMEEEGMPGPELVSVFYAKNINHAEGLTLIGSFEGKTAMDVLTLQNGQETNGIILAKGGREPGGTEKQDCLDLYNQLKEMDKSVRIFHVTGLGGIEGGADGFKLINEGWTFVESVFPYKRVFSKYELVLVSNCINIQVQGGSIKKNYARLLEPFRKELGENKGKQLLDTLETFVLDAGMSSGKTAGFLGIHANTVQYRLKRINEVLGVEITGNRVLPGLTIALALKRLERVVE